MERKEAEMLTETEEGAESKTRKIEERQDQEYREMFV